MKSIIKWRTGLPKQSGLYLVKTTTGKVTIRVLYDPYGGDPGWLSDEVDDEVTAWCKLTL
jgi:hypothetical protein